MEYWVASYVGRAWGRLRGGRGWLRGRGPAACAAVARGDTTLPARDLVAAQEFAARMWFVVGMTGAVVIFAVGTLAEALPKGSWRDGVAYALLAPALVTVISLSEMGMINYRRMQTSRFVVRGGPAAAARPSHARRGLPRRTDFWVIIAIAVVGSVLIYYAKAHPSV